MNRLANPVRVLAAAAALVFALALFQGPLLGRLPATVGDRIEKLPGLGASRGFVAQIASEPAGAKVSIDGRARGETPFFGNATCRAGDTVVIEIVAEGFKPWRRELPCREGDTLRINARLEP